VERTERQHLRSASAVLASVPGSDGRQRGGDFVLLDRFAYLQKTREVFQQAEFICLAIDGVQIGNDNLLNIIAWHGEKDVCSICPPQAGPACLASVAVRHEHSVFSFFYAGTHL
jgi:hypothetical protein